MKPDNIAREKARINRGDYGDKAPGFDPAAAPLGTDDEAAGFSAHPDSGMAARPHPAQPPGQTTSIENSIAPDAAPAKQHGFLRTGVIAVLSVLAIAVVLAWWLVGR